MPWYESTLMLAVEIRETLVRLPLQKKLEDKIKLVRGDGYTKNIKFSYAFMNKVSRRPFVGVLNNSLGYSLCVMLEKFAFKDNYLSVVYLK